MSSSDIYEYSHTSDVVRIEQTTPFQQVTQQILYKYSYKHSIQIPLLINMKNQQWKPPTYTGDMLDGTGYWCSGTCYLFNYGFLANNIFAVFNLFTYNNDISNYKARIFYGINEDFSDMEIYWK